MSCICLCCRTKLCINTAIVLMHRFYMLQSFSKFHRNVSFFHIQKFIFTVFIDVECMNKTDWWMAFFLYYNNIVPGSDVTIRLYRFRSISIGFFDPQFDLDSIRFWFFTICTPLLTQLDSCVSAWERQCCGAGHPRSYPPPLPSSSAWTGKMSNGQSTEKQCGVVTRSWSCQVGQRDSTH